MRDLGLPRPVEPLIIAPPLRVLVLVANPSDLPPLAVENEKRRIEAALANLQERGIVDLHWLVGQTWRDLHETIRRGGFHVLHFIGHGGFDAETDEGMIVLANDAGKSRPLRATDLATLLADEPELRLVVLNSCDGARGGTVDVFSSTASILVRRGIPAVLAMQHEITDAAAIEFARSFYEAIADGVPVDYAVAEGRKAIRIAQPGSFEWITPVLYQEASDGVLFSLERHSALPTTTAPASAHAHPAIAPLLEDEIPRPIPSRDDPVSAPARGAASIWTTLRSVWSSVPNIAKGIGGTITVLAALITALAAAGLIGGSNDDPPPQPTGLAPFMRGELSDAEIEPGVTLGEGCLERGWDCTYYENNQTPIAAQYAVEGIVVRFTARISGYEHRPCPVRWSLWDPEQNAQLLTGSAWPEALIEPEGPLDEVRGYVWVPLPLQDAPFVVRLHLLNDTEAELDSLTTNPFNGLTGMPV